MLTTLSWAACEKPAPNGARRGGLVARLRGRLKCLAHGHADLLHYSRVRIWLACDECGRQTRGWWIGPRPRVLAFRDVAERGAGAAVTRREA